MALYKCYYYYYYYYYYSEFSARKVIVSDQLDMSVQLYDALQKNAADIFTNSTDNFIYLFIVFIYFIYLFILFIMPLAARHT